MFILFERVSFQVLTLIFSLPMGTSHTFVDLHLQNCVCVCESAEGGGKVALQPFRFPISPQKLPDSEKEMGHSIILSWAMGSTCLLMQRGSDLVRALQIREGKV